MSAAVLAERTGVPAADEPRRRDRSQPASQVTVRRAIQSAARPSQVAVAPPLVQEVPQSLGAQLAEAGDCACGGACPRCAEESAVQTKQKVGEAGDHSEQEADRVAPEVMSHADASMHLLAHELAHVVQWQPNVRRPESPAPGGQQLGTGERSFFEPRFGHSLAHVRVHEGAQAASSARRFGALAFTYGNHVVLGDGAQAHTAQRRQLLAHELAHVLQYRGAAGPGRVEIGAPDSAAEAEADVAGERVLAGQTASVTARDAAPVVRRMIPSKKCSNDEHALLILQWMVRLGVYRELLKDARYDNVRAAMLRKIDIAEALVKGYQVCGRVNAPASGIVGFVSTTPGMTPIGPVWSPPAVVAPAPVVEPPVIGTPAPEAPMGMSGGGVGPAVVITLGIAGIEWLLRPTPTGTEIKIEDLKQVMAELEAQMNALRQAVESVTKIGPTVAPSPKVDPRTSPTHPEPDEPRRRREMCPRGHMSNLGTSIGNETTNTGISLMSIERRKTCSHERLSIRTSRCFCWMAESP